MCVCVCVCVYVTAVGSFISTKWQINQGAATVGLRSLSVCTINLQLPPPPFPPLIRQGCGQEQTHPEKQSLLWKTCQAYQTPSPS